MKKNEAGFKCSDEVSLENGHLSRNLKARKERRDFRGDSWEPLPRLGLVHARSSTIPSTAAAEVCSVLASS